MTKKIKDVNKSLVVNPLEGYLGYQLRRLSAASMASLTNSLEEFEIRPSEATVILFIDENPGVRQSLIGKHLGIRRANMAPLIAKLETKGFCQRNPIDGRSSGIKLTQLGKKHSQQIKQKILDNEELYFGKLDSKLLEEFLIILRAINMDKNSL